MKLSDKILVCRKKAGLSQEALAEKIGVSRQAISKWETGEAAPEITKLPLLARTFSVTADWLLDDESAFGEETKSEEPPLEDPAEPSNGHAYAKESPVASAVPAQSYPEWIDHLPGFLGRMLKKYGWLFGVRMAISGALFILIGLVATAMSSSMSNAFNNLEGGMFSAMQNTGVTFYDEAGNMVDPSHFGLTDSDLAALGLGGYAGYSGFSGLTITTSMTEPFDIFGGFIIFLGAMQLVGGLLLALYLKRKGQEAL